MYLGGASTRDTPVNAHTAHLQGRARYVAYPAPDSIEVLRYVPKVCTTRALSRGDANAVFVGQLPRLLPLPFVPWAIDLMLGEYCVRWVLQTQPNGCAKAWTEREDQVDRLVDVSKNLMFDVCGVWVAESPDQQRHLLTYQAYLQMQPTLDPRVPRHGMLIERLKPPKDGAASQRPSLKDLSAVARVKPELPPPAHQASRSLGIKIQLVAPRHADPAGLSVDAPEFKPGFTVLPSFEK